MAIKGHKERALLRRGYHVQEALKRRPILSENSTIRRIIKETKEDIKLYQLCDQETKTGVINSIYCKLSKVLDDLQQNNPSLAEQTYEAIFTLYAFFKPQKKDNRVVFKKTIESILKNENPSNSLILIAKFIEDPVFKDDEVKKALINFRNAESDKVKIFGSFSGSTFADFLKLARYKEYSKYEESFKSQNFDLTRGTSRLSHGQINIDTGKLETFFNIVKDVYEGSRNIKDVVNSISEAVLHTDINDLLYKSDLIVRNDLMVGDTIIIPKGSNVEVKKFNYVIDSYFSEYFSIYKRSDLPTLAKEKDFKVLYNKIIQEVYENLKKRGEFMVKKISDNVNAIMFDDNLIVLNKDIEFYWSNKGQKNCDELRLSIRFRVKNSNITTYTYDSTTHSNQLKALAVTLNPKPRAYC